MTRFLLDHGADPSITGWPVGWPSEATPLLMAVKKGNAETLELLLASGAELRPNKIGLDQLEIAQLTNAYSAVLNVFRQQGYLNHEFNMGYSSLLHYLSGSASPQVMAPILMIQSAASALTGETTPMQAYSTVFPVRDLRRGCAYRKGLIVFAFEARKSGIDLFADAEFCENFVNSWSAARFELASSIISKLVDLGVSDINFFYAVSSFLDNEDENTLKHGETVFETLIASSPRGAARAASGALLNEMMLRSYRHGRLRPVVKALLAIFHPENQIKRSFRSWGFPKNPQDPSNIFVLPQDIASLVMSHLHSAPSDPEFREKAMEKLSQIMERTPHRSFFY